MKYLRSYNIFETISDDDFNKDYAIQLLLDIMYDCGKESVTSYLEFVIDYIKDGFPLVYDYSYLNNSEYKSHRKYKNWNKVNLIDEIINTYDDKLEPFQQFLLWYDPENSKIRNIIETRPPRGFRRSEI
jgi:hypothetical protein